MPDGVARAQKTGIASKKPSSMDVVTAAKNLYPILNSLNLVSSYEPGNAKGMLEFWPPGEPGTTGYYRPKDIPIESMGVQVFDRSKVRPIDILADVTSHHLVKSDPAMKKYYEQFLGSVTPDQQRRFQDDYQHARNVEGEQRPYETWLQTTRLPAYFRGYTFKQWPDKFNKHVFTPEQITLFNEVRKYLGVK